MSESDPKGLKVESLKSDVISPTVVLIFSDRVGDLRTIFLASLQTIFAWSRVFATANMSAPASPSPTIRYKPMADPRSDFPFFLPMMRMTS